MDKFLSALFSGLEEHFFLVWTLADKRSAWFQSTESAVEYIHSRRDNTDIYVGMGLAKEDYGPTKRVNASNVAGISAIWADIDIRNEAHKKANLPPTVDAAMSVALSVGKDPSFVVHSGHGLQVYWVFEEPWIFDDKQERERAHRLVQGWQQCMTTFAAQQGWTVDSTHDLSRVMRVPGTINYKTEPVETELVESSGHTYEPYDLEEMVETPKSSTQVENITLDAQAMPPAEKLWALAEMDPKFQQTLARKRPDLGDESPSGYDMALASITVNAGWEDQEITDLLIFHRRQHGSDLKLREDYYARTISKARTSYVNEAEGILEEPDEEIQRERMLRSLSKEFGIEIVRVVKYLSDPPQYRLETSVGEVMLGGVEAITNQGNFRNRVADATKILIPHMKPQTWHSRAQRLLMVCDEEHVGEEATVKGMARSWLVNYLEDRPPIEDLEDAVYSRNPYTKNGYVYVFGADLRRWLQITQGERMSAKQMGSTLRAFGCEPTQLYAKGTNRAAWKIKDL